jgi:hypothetical protein
MEVVHDGSWVREVKTSYQPMKFSSRYNHKAHVVGGGGGDAAAAALEEAEVTTAAYSPLVKVSGRQTAKVQDCQLYSSWPANPGRQDSRRRITAHSGSG